VGALLNVHEMPIMSNRKSVEIGLKEDMIVTIEPGYYEDGNFGIRIENCVLIVKEKTKYNYSKSVDFVKFEPLTYVPIQKELIQKSLLNEQEIKWLNDYHEMCFSIIGEELKRSNKPDVLAWLREQTRPL
jgi:Xaa-Pro aminopeptidase